MYCVVARAGCFFQPEAISLSARGLLRRAQNALLAMTFSDNVNAPEPELFHLDKKKN
jgi:hypothetical protein